MLLFILYLLTEPIAILDVVGSLEITTAFSFEGALSVHSEPPIKLTKLSKFCTFLFMLPHLL